MRKKLLQTRGDLGREPAGGPPTRQELEGAAEACGGRDVPGSYAFTWVWKEKGRRGWPQSQLHEGRWPKEAGTPDMM